jgi:hypothetical protein
MMRVPGAMVKEIDVAGRGQPTAAARKLGGMHEAKRAGMRDV